MGTKKEKKTVRKHSAEHWVKKRKEERFQNVTLMESLVMPRGPRTDLLPVTLFHLAPEGLSGKVKKDLQALEH